MNYRIRKNKNGSISYQFYYRGYDPRTHKRINKQKTFRLEREYVGKKKYTEKFLFNCEKAIIEKEEKLSRGTFVKDEKIKFIDFATKFVESIIRDKPESYHHYISCKGNLKILEKHFGNYYMHEITQFKIQDFCNYICERTYEKITVTVIKSLRTIIKERKMSFVKVAKGCGIADITLHTALKLGQTVSLDTAEKLCSFLSVPIKKYFNVVKQDVPYSLSANKGLKTLVSRILNKAVKRGLIKRNYAISEFTDSVTGTKGVKEIYDKNELNEFMQCLANEKDLRKKTAFSIMIYLGLRLGEVAGLEWSDINFDKDEIAINRNSSYVKGFGTITKEPKTKCSKATLSVSKGLMSLFKEYRIWWLKQKDLHGDLWQNTDRLFCQSSGKNMAGSTIRTWLIDFEQKNNLKRVTPHEIRHTHITQLIDNNVNIKTVSARARHKDVETTLNIYTHPTTLADKKAADIIDKMLTPDNL